MPRTQNKINCVLFHSVWYFTRAFQCELSRRIFSDVLLENKPGALQQSQCL